VKIFYLLFSIIIFLFICAILFVSIGERFDPMGIVIVLVLLVGLGVLFSIRFMPKKQKILEHSSEKSSLFSINFQDSSRTQLAIGIFLYAIALVDFLNPTIPNESTRWGWFYKTMFDQFGLLGMPLWWFALGSILVVMAFTKTKHM